MLHIINKSLTSSDALKRCLALTQPGAALLLIEDAVYNCIPNSPGYELLLQHSEAVSLYALTEDLEARGLERLVADPFQRVDYPGFVTLTEQHSKSLSWG
ncbi:sulfurtransferase complex subunit TusB [Aestuariirhabdus litorea]|uniref:Sulfurtransferase complex subunit TusB n=1 Tax=Aestuariirhabdus litorea TaxID=2528527 RepID=A0A3P3VPS8_9GAMM|nr:sulfurtransferase complex subunit TusB [Aestuariirhabdus litorea]RRJ84782.1 sulfurtransferase complex subunit TusB [Aestuariirhabdus litorea]RWW98006.1 sulfurtransferase complex subunit TusB [Endozoicomonadaceae bacterium GTF-13]